MKPIYLVAYYFQKPANPRVKTARPGWMKEQNNVSWDEQVGITRYLKNRDITTAKVILDLANRKVVKNDWKRGQEFDELFEYFHRGYPEQTTKIMEQLHPEFSQPAVTVSSEPVRTIDTSNSISSV